MSVWPHGHPVSDVMQTVSSFLCAHDWTSHLPPMTTLTESMPGQHKGLASALYCTVQQPGDFAGMLCQRPVYQWSAYL